jgi:hypothetical protein
MFPQYEQFWTAILDDTSAGSRRRGARTRPRERIGPGRASRTLRQGEADWVDSWADGLELLPQVDTRS